jgi:predicted ribosomally synthesized peptide with nif11-like leader
MAKEEVGRLFRAVQADQNLRETLNSSPNLEAFVKMAQEFGYDFTVKEWKEITGFAVEEMESKISDIPGI